MRSAMSMASDEEILSAMKDLEKVQALQQVHLIPTVAPQDQSINGFLNQLNTISSVSQPQQQIQPTTQIQLPSLHSDSLNLQNILQNNMNLPAMNNTTSIGQYSFLPAQTSTHDIQTVQNTHPDIQKAINDQTILIQEKLATEANTKLVQDLKTISAVIDSKQKLSNQINSTNLSPDTLASMQQMPLLSQIDIKTQVEPINSLISNATQQVDGFLNQGAQQQQLHDQIVASQTLDAILNQTQKKPADDIQNMQKKQELMNSATSAIEGLISIRAEKIANDVIQNNAVQQRQIPISAIDQTSVGSVAQIVSSVMQQSAPLSSNMASLDNQLSNQMVQSLPLSTKDIIAKVSQPQGTVQTSLQQDLKNLNTVANDQQFQSQLLHVTDSLSENIEKKLLEQQKDQKKVPKQDKLLDFLTSAGKISQISLALTPLPTYLGVWNKPRAEQIQRVESISFNYLLMVIMSSAIWTSYAFKTQNIDLAIVSVIPLIITIILTAIYLSVKPESHLIKQFVFIVIISQIFNFDLIPVTMCGMLGTIFSVASNAVPLMFMPEVIQTRDVSGINLPLTLVNVCNLTIWECIALYIGDPFMTTSQFLGLTFNLIQLLFFCWAKKMISSQDTPNIWVIMKFLLKFFKLFEVQKNLNELKSFFWQDENTQFAKAYIKQYTDDISDIQSQYSKSDNISYEQHMQNMRKINHKLKTLSENGKMYGPDTESGQTSQESTQEGSSKKNQNYMNHQNDDFVYQNQYGQQVQFKDQHYQNQQYYNHDDFSENSFNSSMNFAKLQNSINFRQSAQANQSESSNYFKSRLAQNGFASHQRQGVSKINYNNDFGNESTIILEDFPTTGKDSQIPKTVKEESVEDELSCKNDRTYNDVQDNMGPRSSVASILSAISQNPLEDATQLDNHNFEDLRQRALKVKDSNKRKKQGGSMAEIQKQQQNTTIELDYIDKLGQQTDQEVNKSLDIKQNNLNTFFDHEKNMQNLPGQDGQHYDEDDNLLSNESSSGPINGAAEANTTMSSQMNNFDNRSNPDQQHQSQENDEIMLKNL